MHKYLILAASALLLGCPPEVMSDGGDEDTSATMGIDSLSTAGMTTAMTTMEMTTMDPDSGSGSGGTDDECMSSTDCEAGVCVAPYSRANGQGNFACVAECVENFDSARWCSDDAACCDASATCTAVGLCDGAAATDGGMTDDGTTDDGTTDDGTDGTTSDGSTGSGSGSSSTG